MMPLPHLTLAGVRRHWGSGAVVVVEEIHSPSVESPVQPGASTGPLLAVVAVPRR
jgi:hypothetical protein